MFPAAFFTIDKIQESINKWMDKQNVGCIYTEYYSALKVKEILQYTTTCVNFEDIMPK